MADIFVTIVSPKKHYKEIQKGVRVGTVLSFIKDDNNLFDPDAIVVNIKGKQLGYISKQPNSFKGTKFNKELRPLFKSFGEMKVTEILDAKHGHNEQSFIAKITSFDGEEVNGQKEAVKMKDAVNHSHKVLLKGQKSLYSARQKLFDKARDGKKPVINLALRKSDNKIVGYYEDEPAGYVDIDFVGEGFSDGKEIQQIFNDKEVESIIGVAVSTIGRGAVVSFDFETDGLSPVANVEVGGKSMEEIIALGIATKEEISDRIEYMKKYGATEKQIAGVFATYQKYEPDLEMRIPKKPRTLFIDSEGFVPEAIAYINRKNNLLFEGDKAVGKNVLVETLAWLYKRPLFVLSMNADYDNTTLIGTRTIESDSNGNPQMKFELGVAAIAAKHGCFLVYDEFNTAHPGMMTIFHSLLDKNRKLEVTGYGLIEASDNFVAIATQNRDYQGTMDNNKATASRFVPFVFPELKSISEVLLENVPNIKIGTITTLQEYFDSIKKLVFDGQISSEALDLRSFEAAADVFTNMDIPLKRALKTNVVNRMDDSEERIIVESLLDDLLG